MYSSQHQLHYVLKSAVIFLLCCIGVTQARAQEPPRDEAATQGVELILNGGFEEPLTASNQSPSWSDNSAWAPVQVRYSAETAAPHGGQCAWKIECAEFKGGAVQFVQYGVPLEKGAVYRISLWMKGKVDSPVEILLRKSPAPYTTYASRLFTVGEEWAQYTFEGAIEETDAAALFIIRLGATGALVIDDVSCRRVGTTSSTLRLQPPARTIPSTLFGLHIHRNNEKLAWPPVPFGSLRLWDARVSWPQLEPEAGKWEWGRLDTYLKLASEHNVEVLLPLGLTPMWASARPQEKSAYNGAGVSRQTGWAAEPRDFALWDNYVRTVAEHCRGKVHDYEVWNEPNMVPFYSGTIEQLVELTRRAAGVLRQVDAGNRIVSPPVVGDHLYLDSFWRRLLQGDGPATDVVGFHFYVWPDPPEKMVPPITRVQEVLAANGGANRPLWNTEAGWNIESIVAPRPAEAFQNGPPLSMHTASSYIARAYILNWAAGVERFYFYAWDNDLMGLVEKDGTLKPPARAYAEVYRWLVGARMVSCTRDASGTWTAHLSRDGNPSVIVWNAEKESKFTPPHDWQAGRITTLAGERRALKTDEAIVVSGSPVLIECSAYPIRTG